MLPDLVTKIAVNMAAAKRRPTTMNANVIHPNFFFRLLRFSSAVRFSGMFVSYFPAWMFGLSLLIRYAPTLVSAQSPCTREGVRESLPESGEVLPQGGS